MSRFFGHKKDFFEEEVTVSAPGGSLTIPLPFVPRFIEAAFLDKAAPSCSNAAQDEISISAQNKSIVLQWTVATARRVKWKAQK